MATRAQGNQVSNSFFGFCVPDKDKYGNPFTEWDGVTYADYFDFSNDYGGYGPSKSSSDFIPVYGGTADISVGANGSPRPTGFTLHEMMEIVFGVKGFSTDLSSILDYVVEIPEISGGGFSGYKETEAYGPRVPYTATVDGVVRTYYTQHYTYTLEEFPLEPYSGKTLDTSGYFRKVANFTSSTQHIYDEDANSFVFTTNAPHPKTICAPHWDTTEEGLSDYGTGRPNSLRFLLAKYDNEYYTQSVGTTHPARIYVGGALGVHINFDMSAIDIIKAEEKFWPFFKSGDVVIGSNDGTTYYVNGYYSTLLVGFEAGAATVVESTYDSRTRIWSNGFPPDIKEENKPVEKTEVRDGKGGVWLYGYGDGSPAFILGSEGFEDSSDFTVKLILPSGKEHTLVSRPIKYNKFYSDVEPLDAPPSSFTITAEGWD